ncbi:MAG: PAS domain-containing protein [Deltaproteobacteria bacterium]|nr:PAS domain-containing protein [Deltaproteobacteria bacterium]
MKHGDVKEGDLKIELAALRRRVARLERLEAEWRKTEKALRESEERYALATSAGHVGTWDWNLETNEIYIDPNLKAMLGYKDNEIRNHLDDWGRFVHPDDVEEVMRKAEAHLKGSAPLYEVAHRMLHKDGSVRWFLARGTAMRDGNGKPYRVVGTDTDITERKRVEEELRRHREHLEELVEARTAELRKTNERLQREIAERKQTEEQLLWSQKMETVGRLAGGIAHDFNNLLVTIQGNTELVMMEPGLEEWVRNRLEEVFKACSRAAKLTQQLLTFSRRQIVEPKVVNLNKIILDMGKMLPRLIGEDVEVVSLPGEALGMVKVDPGQLEQVIVNLAVNARDAMPQGGRLAIETANVTLDEGYARQHPGVTPGGYVMLAISDTGAGMADEVKEHIFEPFFTTKDVGKGTGLGLATCYGIVKQSGGNIWVYSEPGLGTTFKIYLPRIDGQGEAMERHSREGYPPRGSETVLLVEDELSVRNVTAGTLRAQGYTVLEASDGKEALAVARQHRDRRIDLLLTDVVMPQMGGRALAERLLAERPDTKVLFFSGYPGEAIVHHGVLDRGSAFLQKPFSPAGLAWKVREVLDG